MSIILNSFRNPRYNSDINPRYNPGINPSINSKINPKFNSRINPKFNQTINPNRRLELNPFIYPLKNPLKCNYMQSRSHINSINIVKRSYLGPLVFSIDCDLIGFALMIPEIFGYALFDLDSTFLYYCVPNMKGGFNLFDAKFKWDGYLVSNSEGGFNGFELDGTWRFFIIV